MHNKHLHVRGSWYARRLLFARYATISLLLHLEVCSGTSVVYMLMTTISEFVVAFLDVKLLSKSFLHGDRTYTKSTEMIALWKKLPIKRFAFCLEFIQRFMYDYSGITCGTSRKIQVCLSLMAPIGTGTLQLKTLVEWKEIRKEHSWEQVGYLSWKLEMGVSYQY